MPAAAFTPLPITSPTTAATRPSCSTNASYQSPPTCTWRLPERNRCASIRPFTTGRRSGSRLRCSVSAVECSRSNSVARSTASAHWPASASRKTPSSWEIFCGPGEREPQRAQRPPGGEQRQPHPGALVAGEHRLDHALVGARVGELLAQVSGDSANTGRRLFTAMVEHVGVVERDLIPGDALQVGDAARR